jgi:hypothetical protein
MRKIICLRNLLDNHQSQVPTIQLLSTNKMIMKKIMKMKKMKKMIIIFVIRILKRKTLVDIIELDKMRVMKQILIPIK